MVDRDSGLVASLSPEAETAECIDTPARLRHSLTDKPTRSTAAEMRRLGRYAEAVEKLSDALDALPYDQDLVFELAETYSQQGYINRSYELIARLKGAHQVVPDKIAIFGCYLEPMTSGHFSASAAEADTIMQKYRTIDDLDLAWEEVASLHGFTV